MKAFKVLLMSVLTTVAIPVFAQKGTAKLFVNPSKNVTNNTHQHGQAMMQKTGTSSARCTNLAKSPKEQMKMNIVKTYTSAIDHDGIAYSYTCLSPKEQMKLVAMK